MIKKKLAIIGASYLQVPIVMECKKLGIESHVFAWKEGNIAGDISDYYYPVSILDKEEILRICSQLKIDGIVSIASDISMPTVSYVASKLGLVSNSIESTILSTDKFEMRKALKKEGLLVPDFRLYNIPSYEESDNLHFPVVVKPTDRSGARGVSYIHDVNEINDAIDKALSNSINKRAIVEEYVEGREFSVELISFNGIHYNLAVTDKVTTGPPFFVEIQHHQPASIPDELKVRIFRTVQAALNALGIKFGASHSEVLVTKQDEIYIVEIAGRMGGDMIGSDMVFHSTGYNFINAVIQVALNNFDEKFIPDKLEKNFSGVYYIFPDPGRIETIDDKSDNFPEVVKCIALKKVGDIVETVIDSSDKRSGVILYASKLGKLDLDPGEILQIITV